MKNLLIITGLLILAACGSQEVPEKPLEKKKKKTEAPGKTSAGIERYIQTKLDLTTADKYDLVTYEQELTGDDSTDLIITVNLLDRALNEAVKLNREERMKEMGYMGYYNYVFFVDGETKEISEGFVVPSSPMYPLKVNFEKVLGTPKMDVTIDYRVRNMQRRKFLTVTNNQLVEVCQAVIFDGFGTSETVAYDIRYEEGTFNDFNDIVEYRAELDNRIIPNLDSTYYFDPAVIPTDNEVRRWHYSPGQGKYFLVQKDE